MENYMKKTGLTMIFSALLLFAGSIYLTAKPCYGMDESNTPEEVWVQVFDNLTPKDALSLATVSHSFHTVLCNPQTHLLMGKKLQHTGLFQAYGFCLNRTESFTNSVINTLSHINIKRFSFPIQLKMLLAQFSATQDPLYAKEFVALYETKRPPAFLQVYSTMKKRAQEQ